MAADVTFFVGEEFTSFTELHRRIQTFQLRNSVQLYIRSSRKIQAAQVRSTDGYNPELKFAEIYYACVRGGRKFQTRANASSNTNARHYGRAEQSRWVREKRERDRPLIAADQLMISAPALSQRCVPLGCRRS